MNKLVKSTLFVISLFATSGLSTFSGQKEEIDELRSRINALKPRIDLVFTEEFKELRKRFPETHFFVPSNSVFMEMFEDIYYMIQSLGYCNNEINFKEKYAEICLLLKREELKVKIDSLPAAKDLQIKFVREVARKLKLVLTQRELDLKELTENPKIFRDGGRALNGMIDSFKEYDINDLFKNSPELREMQKEV